MELLEYLEKNHPEVIDEYKRATTPFYYEPGVLYHPIRAGFSCGEGGSMRPLEIINATYLRDGDMEFHLKGKDGSMFGCNISEAPTSIKRIDDSVAPVGRKIPNNRQRIYMNVNGIDWNITQMYWRDYSSKRLGGRVWVSQDTGNRQFVADKQPYYELYSVIGQGTWNLKHTYSYDSVGRENYNIKFGISVREFKEKVFGDPNIKLKCQLFPD